MKRLAALCLCLSLCGGIMSALAERWYVEDAGHYITLPDSAAAVDVSQDGFSMLSITYPDAPNVSFLYTAYFDEQLDGMSMQDLTDEQGDALLAHFETTLGVTAFNMTQMNGVLVLIAAREDGAALHYITLVGGAVSLVSAVNVEGEALDETAIAFAGGLMLGIEYPAA